MSTRLQDAALSYAEANERGPQEAIDRAASVLEQVALEFASATLASQAAALKKLNRENTAGINHSSLTTKYFEPLLGFCVCQHCKALPEYLTCQHLSEDGGHVCLARQGHEGEHSMYPCY